MGNWLKGNDYNDAEQTNPLPLFSIRLQMVITTLLAFFLVLNTQDTLYGQLLLP